MAKRAKKRGRRKGSGKTSALRTWFWRLARIGLVSALFGLVTVGVAVGTAVSNLPSYEELKASPNGQMILVRAADGSEIVQLGPSFGQWLKHEDIPQVMKDAMIAVEDRRYYGHLGVDPIGLARAAWVGIKNYGTGKRWQGASTISQ